MHDHIVEEIRPDHTWEIFKDVKLARYSTQYSFAGSNDDESDGSSCTTHYDTDGDLDWSFKYKYHKYPNIVSFQLSIDSVNRDAANGEEVNVHGQCFLGDERWHPVINLEFDRRKGLTKKSSSCLLTDFTGASIFIEVVVTRRTVPACKLTDDFAALLKLETLSDVTLVHGEREFKSHKAILAARSPVFASIFENKVGDGVSEIAPSSLGSTNRVQVIGELDCDGDDVAELLRFLYTGKSPLLALDRKRNKLSSLDGLLTLANRYALEDLRSACEDSLLGCARSDNVADLLVKADQIRCPGLKSRLIDYAIERLGEVARSEAYERMAEAQPHLVDEILQAQAERMEVSEGGRSYNVEEKASLVVLKESSIDM